MSAREYFCSYRKKHSCTTEKEVVSSSDNDPIADFTSDVENDAKIESDAGRTHG